MYQLYVRILLSMYVTDSGLWENTSFLF